ncbi:hypothetical protein CFC21_038620 [Triticum aestivum]|uniref:NB-ARC domain-containing protein n=2 Tax=Triticum aestivum TaxID=4565 RepID=A0A3B6EVD3_WHEAT|nr:hypothetical protein CFC21_038620 [Triticum aestivum]
MLQFLRTVPVRHRVATRIRELKDRVREVGKRRQRYGVTVPSVAAEQGPAGGALTLIDDVEQLQTSLASAGDIWGRSLLELELDLDGEALFNQGIQHVIEEHIHNQYIGEPTCPHVLQILWDNKTMWDKPFVDRFALEIYHRCSRSALFEWKARVPAMYIDSDRYIHNWYGDGEIVTDLQQHIMRQIPAMISSAADIQTYLRRKRVLILLESTHKTHDTYHKTIKELIGDDDSDDYGFRRDRSIIIITADVTYSSHNYTRVYPPRAIYKAFYDKAKELTHEGVHCNHQYVEEILDKCYPRAFTMKMFMHLLQANPQRTDNELQNIMGSISSCIRLNKSVPKQMLMWCYNDLPSKYKSCLMYLSIFPKDRTITRTILVRRWIAEGLINPTREYYTTQGQLDNATTLEVVAKHHFEMLVARGFIRPADISDACNIKTCTLYHEASEFIARIAIDVNFVDTDLPQSFAQHLSIHNKIPLQACHPPMEVANDIVASLPYLAKSSQWKLLKVMDLEGCRGLKKKHLKIICKIILLRYFSLGNTDVTELPKQIEMLTCLETLDIRQTTVRAFATKSIMLPMLKHMLAGESQTCPPPSNNNPERFQESFVGVRLPNGVQRMEKLEMLSHVDVSHSVDDMISIGQLLRLRKLGVILDRKNRDGLLDLLFQQIEKLHGCLRSLSIQVNHPVTSDGVIIHDDADEVHALGSPPKLLRSLNIRGIRNGLLGWIAELDKLVKLTLSETYLGEDALGIIGNLGVLACLRLLHKSYNGSKLHIKNGEFISLKSLIVRGNDITSIHFNEGASPKLEMFVWSFARMEAMDGLDELYYLKKVELYGDCNPQPLRDQMWRRLYFQYLQDQMWRRLDFKHNGQQMLVQRDYEDVVAV